MGDGRHGSGSGREARLAAALRANLRRRKSQSQARAQPPRGQDGQDGQDGRSQAGEGSRRHGAATPGEPESD